MSNFLAIATVTATLRRVLQGVVGEDVSGATVTTLPLTSGGTGLPEPGVNLLLYQITPNPSLRNRDLPSRRSDGSVAERPSAALDLHYLFSFHGDGNTLEPQRLLGSVARTLHAQPVLTRQMVRDTVADPTFGFLAGSDLADEVELVRLTPFALSLEQLFQLWSGLLSKAEFALSIVYSASVVLLTTDEQASQALPVRERTVLVQPFRSPRIDAVIAEAGAAAPITVGSTVRLVGQRLRADLVRVRIAGQEIEPLAVSDSEVRFLLDTPAIDPDVLQAGPTVVQVLHPYLVGVPPAPRPGVESNLGVFVLRPRVIHAEHDGGGVGARGVETGGTTATLTLEISPSLGMGQRASVLLNPASGSAPPAYVFPVPRSDFSTSVVTVPVPAIAPGTYLVRLEIDGAQSPLVVDDDPASPTFGQYIGPRVTVGGKA